MIKHIFKLLWKQKRNFIAIYIEQMLVALILMFCIFTIASALRSYRDPGMLDTDSTVYFGYMTPKNLKDKKVYGRLLKNMDAICANLEDLPFVESITKTANLTPYLRPDGKYRADTINVDNTKIYTVIKASDVKGEVVYRPIIEEGKWIDAVKEEDGTYQMVITRQFQEKANWNEAIGKKVKMDVRDFTVVGVIAGAKQQPFEPSPAAVIVPDEIFKNIPFFEYTARIKGNNKSTFYDAFSKEFSRYVEDKEIEPVIMDMDSLKESSLLNVTLGVVFQSIPTFFLLIFAFIGTFGLFWLNSKKRIREFALRIALGSTPRQLIGIVILESLVITFFACLPALLLSLVIFSYSLTNLISMLVTVMLMLAFSVVSSWYPAWKVSKINPIEALKYE